MRGPHWLGNLELVQGHYKKIMHFERCSSRWWIVDAKENLAFKQREGKSWKMLAQPTFFKMLFGFGKFTRNCRHKSTVSVYKYGDTDKKSPRSFRFLSISSCSLKNDSKSNCIRPSFNSEKINAQIHFFLLNVGNKNLGTVRINIQSVNWPKIKLIFEQTILSAFKPWPSCGPFCRPVESSRIWAPRFTYTLDTSYNPTVRLVIG